MKPKPNRQRGNRGWTAAFYSLILFALCGLIVVLMLETETKPVIETAISEPDHIPEVSKMVEPQILPRPIPREIVTSVPQVRQSPFFGQVVEPFVPNFEGEPANFREGIQRAMGSAPIVQPIGEALAMKKGKRIAKRNGLAVIEVWKAEVSAPLVTEDQSHLLFAKIADGKHPAGVVQLAAGTNTIRNLLQGYMIDPETGLRAQSLTIESETARELAIYGSSLLEAIEVNGQHVRVGAHTFTKDTL